MATPAPLIPHAAYGAAQPSLWCPAMRQGVNLPQVNLRAARFSPATKLMPRPFPPLKTTAPMTRVMGQVSPKVAACSSEAAASPEVVHPTSAAAPRPSSFLFLKAAAVPSPEGEASLPIVAPCENVPAPRSSPWFPSRTIFSYTRPRPGGDTPYGRLVSSAIEYVPLCRLRVNLVALSHA